LPLVKQPGMALSPQTGELLCYVEEKVWKNPCIRVVIICSAKR
jgi:hypothetical protein